MPASGRRRLVWYPLPRRGVRVVDGAALEKRCAKAPRVRIPPSPPPHPITRTGRNLGPMASRGSASGLGAAAVAPRYPVDSGRGRLVDYGAALEMRFGATRRGFESRPLRHTRVTPGRPMPALTPAVLAHAPQGALAPVLGRRLGLDRPLAPLTPRRRAVTRATPGRVTRPSCHATMKYADTDDPMARVWRPLPPNKAIEVRTACPDARYAGSTVAGPAASGHKVVAMRDVHDRLARGARLRRPPPLQVPCRARLEHPAFRMTADTGNLRRSAAEWGSRAFRSAAEDSFRRQVERWRTQTPRATH